MDHEAGLAACQTHRAFCVFLDGSAARPGRAGASGMAKQVYLCKRAFEDEVVFKPDVRAHKIIRDEMAHVLGAQAHAIRQRGLRMGRRLNR